MKIFSYAMLNIHQHVNRDANGKYRYKDLQAFYWYFSCEAASKPDANTMCDHDQHQKS